MSKSDGWGLRRIALVALAGVAAAVIAACGSSSNGSGASSSSTSASSAAASSPAPKGRSFTGRPVKLGIIINVGAAVNWDHVLAAAKASVRQVNGEGGIDGHEVSLDFCNESLNPNNASACARKMVSDHVMAMVDDGVATAEAQVNAILKAAGIPQVGTQTFSGASATDSNNYLALEEDSAIAGEIQYAVKSGDKRIAMVVLQSPITDTYIPLAKGISSQLGGQFVGKVDVPQTFADLSTQAAALMAMKPQAILFEASPASALAISKTLVQLGYTGKFFTDGNQLNQSQVESLGSVANHQYFVSQFPPVTQTSVKGVSEFRAAIKAEKAAGDSAADTSTQLPSNEDEAVWADVKLVQNIAKAAKATTSVEFKKAIDKAKNVSTDGMLPPVTPNATNASPVIARMANPDMYDFYWSNGGVHLASSKPSSVESLLAKNMPKTS